MYTVPKLEDYSPAALDRAVADLFAALDAETAALHSDSDWREFRDRWLARKNGLLTQVNDNWLKAAPKEAKRDVGQRINALNPQAEELVKVAGLVLLYEVAAGTPSEQAQVRVNVEEARQRKLAAERLDITLPGVARPIGTKHPVLRVMDEIVAVFSAMGYSVGEGPEVETDY